MGKLWVVARREYTERVRSKWFLFATILGPLFFGIMTIGPIVLSQHAQMSVDASHIIVLDETGTGLGHRVVSNLGSGVAYDTSTATLRVVPPEQRAAAESTALRDVMQSRWVGYLVLTDSTVAGTSARYNGRNASALPDIDHVNEVIKQAVLTERLSGAGLDPSRVRALTNVPLKVHTERVTDRGLGGSGVSGAIFGYIVAFLLYTTIVLYGQSIVRGVADEKSTRVSEIVISSVSPDTLLGGKILGVGGVAVTQQFLWVLASGALVIWHKPIFHLVGLPPEMELPIPSITAGAAVVLVLIFLLGFFFYASLFAAVGSTVENQEDAQQATLPVTLFLLMSVIFVGPVFLSPNGPIARVMSWIPFSAPIIMPLRLSLIQVPPLEIVGSLASLVVANLIAVWFAARVFRTGVLMYGKRRSLREVIRWVRAS